MSSNSVGRNALITLNSLISSASVSLNSVSNTLLPVECSACAKARFYLVQLSLSAAKVVKF